MKIFAACYLLVGFGLWLWHRFSADEEVREFFDAAPWHVHAQMFLIDFLGWPMIMYDIVFDK